MPKSNRAWPRTGTSRASAEWEQILKRPWREVRAIVLEESDEGQRLRSSHPFRGIVTEEERVETIKRHPPPWAHEPFDPSKIPPRVMEEILSEGVSGRGRKRRPRERDDCVESSTQGKTTRRA